jgi:8-oxo-dGTP pyrophosphatase MutT (NUDIX family)
MAFFNRRDNFMSKTTHKDSEPKHRNDIYGDVRKATKDEENPPIPAATVVLLHDGPGGVEVLMLHRTTRVQFGGMWVFPGGRIDPEDYPVDKDINTAARNAAVRETLEETALSVAADEFCLFAHWTPPPSTPRRYATWFFAAATSQRDEAIAVDGHEIQDHEWILPADALAKHAAGEIDLAPPTWMTLHQLTQRNTTAEILKHFASKPTRVYVTHVGVRTDGARVAMWDGDAGYVDTNPDAEGERHRLVMAEHGFQLENTFDPD